MKRIATDEHLKIGAIIFPGIDQFDFTGPFEVLSRIPNSTFYIGWKEKTPVRDARGLWLTPEMTLAEMPALDVLLVPGGAGQIELMEDETVLEFIRKQAAGAKLVFTVCTGALTLGAAGLLRGVRSTTHWASFHVLEHLGAIPTNERVVVDGKFVSAAGVSSGIDGSLIVVAMLRGERVAEGLQLYIEYAPQPPFNSGTPETAPAKLVAEARAAAREFGERRVEIAKRVSAGFPRR